MDPVGVADELLARRKARLSFSGYCEYRNRDTPFEKTYSAHHRLLASALDDVERGVCEKLMVMMPPGSAKSTYSSVYFPEYFLGRNPQLQIICGSNILELAESFGRKVRNAVASPEFGVIWPGVTLSDDNSAAHRWGLNKGGEYYAVGVGGTVAGRRGDVAIIDDPIKNREHADSERMRQRDWDWWNHDLVSRMKPNARLVLVMCMTGDTPVLRPDGTQTELRDIRPGDEIATYEDGSLSIAVVKNWANQGPDDVYSLVMASGRTVRANARHPFLVVGGDGAETWVRLGSLRAGMKVRSVEGLIPVSSALRTTATDPPSARACACRTTAEPATPPAIGHRRPAMQGDARFGSRVGTGSLSRTTAGSLQSRTGAAQSAGSAPMRSSGPSTGPRSSASIMTTTLESCGGCSATIATSLWDGPTPRTFSEKPLLTWSAGTDEIVEIVEVGREDVFDIEVDRTHNFIANGLTVSNTRWHEDDLAGRLLDRERGEWRVIKLPMLAGKDDPLDRPEGQALWREWFTPDMVRQAQKDPRAWISLYQQEPRPADGAEFKRAWIQRYQSPPQRSNKIMLVDPAGTQTNKSDFTSIWVVALGPDENFYLIDGLRDRLNLTQRIDAVFRMHKRHRPYQTRYEQYGMQADIEAMQAEMERRQYRFSIKRVAGGIQKEARIRRLIPHFESGRIWLPVDMIRQTVAGEAVDVIKAFIDEEYVTFPVGRHDDALDNLARLFEPGLSMPWPDEGPPVMNDASSESQMLDPVAGY